MRHKPVEWLTDWLAYCGDVALCHVKYGTEIRVSKVSGHISRFGFMVRREKAVHGVEGEGRGMGMCDWMEPEKTYRPNEFHVP